MIASLKSNEYRFERLRTLTEVSRLLTYTTSIDEILELAVERAADLVGADRALIMLTDDDGLLTVQAAHGVDADRIGEFREPLEESLVRRLQGLLDYQSEESFLSVPLVAQGEVTGLLATVRPGGDPSRDDDEWLLSALADQAAVALENARLAEAVGRERAERSRVVEAEGRARATLSHELRSPLTAIQAYASLLLDGLFGPLEDRQRESISRIRMSGQHLLAIIENLLDLARIDAGTLTLSTRSVQVEDVVAEAVQMLQPRLDEKKQELRSDCPGNLTVHADPDRLRQALVNLIGNAIKYTPEGGTVRVEVAVTERADEEVAAIAVSDDGRGMSPEVLPTIFEAYDRGGAESHESGVGLGLFISRELLREMDGEIHVESEPGAGSTFTAFLPLATRAPRTPAN